MNLLPLSLYKSYLFFMSRVAKECVLIFLSMRICQKEDPKIICRKKSFYFKITLIITKDV